MAYYDQGCCNPCNYKPSCCSPCSCPPSCGSSSCCNPCSCGCQGSSAPNQPSYICANGYMNDYARCALARYDQLSYDLDSLPVLPCNPSCYPCGSCCGCPYPCPPTTPAPNPNPCPNAPSYLNAVNDPEQTVPTGFPAATASSILPEPPTLPSTVPVSTWSNIMPTHRSQAAPTLLFLFLCSPAV